MAAPKGKEKIEELFIEVINDISENGSSLIASLKGRMSASTFYEMLKDETKSKMYARAREDRADLMADEILLISDAKDTDVNRDRLRVDTRKWLLSKLQPKKYGDKLDIEHTGGITLHFDKDDAKL
jgi:hypothetical protein